MADLHVGTSGWSYTPWAARFYAGIKRPAWLPHYAARFDAVELNVSFYRFIRAETYAKWRDATPTRFRFAIKGHRAVTHEQRLREAEALVRRQRESAAALGERLAAVLWQLPRSLAKDSAVLDGFLQALAAWPEARQAIEFRHPSWFGDDTAQRLAAARVAVAISDAAVWPPWNRVTTDLVYVRLHGRPRTYISAYDDAALDQWSRRVTAWRTEGRSVHVYFDNTMHGAAPDDAARFRARLGAAMPALADAATA